jgi:hypothetical protein
MTAVNAGHKWWIAVVGIPLAVAVIGLARCSGDKPVPVNVVINNINGLPQVVANPKLLGAQQELQLNELKDKRAPFAYRLSECQKTWVNFGGKRIWVKDPAGLYCSENCPIESIGLLIAEDETRYYDGGKIRFVADAPPGPTPPQCFAHVDGVCTVDTPRVVLGTPVIFTGWGSGGTGEYAFSWSGDDDNESQDRDLVANFKTPGVKSATVQITSNGESIYRTCSVIVVPPR